MRFDFMQIVRLVAMVLAIAGIIYALEYLERGIAVWFWVGLLGFGFAGLLYTFRLVQRASGSSAVPTSAARRGAAASGRSNK